MVKASRPLFFEEKPLADSRTQFVGQKMIANFVRKKSAIKMAIDTTTTVRVVLLPTPADPPRVAIPK